MQQLNTMKLQDTNFRVDIIRKKRLKNIYLQLTSKNVLQIKANKYVSIRYIKEFILEKKFWILKKNKELKYIDDNGFLYLDNICLFRDYNITKETLDQFYRDKAQEVILPLVEEYSKKMQLFPTAIKFRRNKTRWGSCSYKNIINFNIYLMKKDIDFIKYVVIHELAHIKHKNHQKSFWDLVKEYQ